MRNAKEKKIHMLSIKHGKKETSNNINNKPNKDKKYQRETIFVGAGERSIKNSKKKTIFN